MAEVKSIYKKLLIGAIVLWVIAATYMFSELYYKTEKLNHIISHLSIH